MSDPIAARCRTDFEPAFHNSGQRNPTTDIFWIVLHDEEAPTAAGSARYFQSPDSGGSAHLCVDDDACYRCLPNSAIPWGAASAFGANTHGFHIEQAGFARWSAVLWERHRLTLQRAAYKTAVHALAFKVPLVFVTAAELPEHHGITTHAEVSKASRRIDPANASRYSHSDPGLFWPRARFVAQVRAYAAQLRG